MPATFTLPLITVIPGQTITASLWNNEYSNIYDNFTPAGMDDYSVNDTQMQTATDPYPASATSRPTSLQGEIERIRYQLASILGETYWYIDPDVDIATMKTRFDAHTHDGTSNQGTQIGTSGISDAAITAAKIDSAVAGNGLAGGAGTALSVNVDGSTIEISSDSLRVKDGGISTAKIASAAVDENKIAASVAGNGLAGGAGTALSVNTDGSTLEISSDSLRVKDAGITQAKLATAVVNQLGQNIGLTTIVSSASNATLVNYSGQGRLRMIGAEAGTVNAWTLTIDGIVISGPTLTSGQIAVFSASSPYIAGATGGAGAAAADFLFKTSLVVAKSAGAGNLVIIYERAA